MCSWFAFDNCWCTNERCHSLSLDTDLSMLRRAPHLSADAGRGILGHRQTGESRPQMLVLVGEVNPFRLTGKALHMYPEHQIPQPLDQVLLKQSSPVQPHSADNTSEARQRVHSSDRGQSQSDLCHSKASLKKGVLPRSGTRSGSSQNGGSLNSSKL